MPAATPAFSDSVRAAIGMRTSTSQAWATIRDRPRPSDPMTRTSGAVASSRSRIGVSPAASRPATKTPASRYDWSARARLAARATGTRASAPADAFQAPAVTPAPRRAGTTTPCAPNAAADRTTAPRLRGSVTPSRATLSGSCLEHGHAAVGGQLDGLADPLVVLHAGADVQDRRGHGGPQRLDHRVTPGDELGRIPGAALRTRGRAGRHEGRSRTVVLTPATRPTRGWGGRRAPRGRGGRRAPRGRGGRRAPRGRVTRPHDRGRGRTLTLQLAFALAARARPRLARLRPAGPGTTGPGPTRPGPASTGTPGTRTARSRAPGSAQRFSSHRGPSGVSSTTTPISSRPSLIASAVA